MDLFERAAYNAFLSGYGDERRICFSIPIPSPPYGQQERTPGSLAPAARPTSPASSPSSAGSPTASRAIRSIVNLYAQGTAEIETEAGKVGLEQTTEYPWKGEIKITRRARESRGLDALMVRIPGWAQGKPLPSDLYRYAGEATEKPVVKVNGEAVALNIDKGYAPIARTWKKDDTVEISPADARAPRPGEREHQGRHRTGGGRARAARLLRRMDRTTTAMSSNLVLDDKAVLKAEAAAGASERRHGHHRRGDGLSLQRAASRRAKSGSSRSSRIMPGPTAAGARWKSGSPANRDKARADPRADARPRRPRRALRRRRRASRRSTISSSRRIPTTTATATSTGGRRRGRPNGSNTISAAPVTVLRNVRLLVRRHGRGRVPRAGLVEGAV